MTNLWKPLRRFAAGAALAAAIAAAASVTLQGDDAAEYAQIVQQVQKELAIPFNSPDDPKLLERRARLRALFGKVPVSHAQTLFGRLGLKATADELSKAFHGKLHSATRRELLDILQGKIAAAAAAPTPAPKPAPVHVWGTRPLPPSESGRFDTALQKLEAKVKGSGDPRTWRYECWFNKLKAPNADDRVIEWSRICPAKTGALGAAYIVGPCDITQGFPVSQDEIYKNIKAIGDVDTRGVAIGIVTHLKADIVVSEELTALPLENLRATHDRVVEAIDKLDKWANNPAGGSSMMAKEYVAIKDWIGQRQRDSTSVYSCK
jgi:hypothetical protein